ncbi:RNA polymerase, sigma subunit, ECF family [Bernardetia litoralis DSM 6794]|uniref:RNA polymerase, sigma subunit, ECF family n=1 Tax=Bernardetia litoralis (strain ATCC 23117 / DSM 6794 / NBRC 15988 / NCIMB 1366 / Fx l1 / Sio-4) TaxID=880071 RepID=I4ANY1_BERLS|nr:sigma-70 family RNA polymerase sigma factor [Bernardetia litoralis]AFM05666.1 RNA polymerase, sigma subunit, ECF family [Bernardetia litoralis DSM 6794]
MQTKTNLSKEKKSKINSGTKSTNTSTNKKRKKDSLPLEELLQANDSQLITLYKSGDNNAFAVLLNRHKNRIFTILITIVKDTYIAEDLMQEAFIKVVDTIRLGKYNEEGKFLPWLSRIAHNLAIDYFRKQKRYPTITVEDGSTVFNTIEFTQKSSEEAHIEQEICENLKRHVRQLPDAQREVLIMRQYFNMSFQEIADATHVSINTALGRMRYALINLRKLMDASEGINNEVNKSAN